MLTIRSRTPIGRLILGALICCATVWLVNSVQSAEAGASGQQIYQSLCARCHGPTGEGTADKYSEPLVGDKPMVELARIIDQTMPEGEPHKCVGEAAQKVAAYIYDAFYSPVAQARNRPARIELSRLTGRQYQNAVSDLVGSFGSLQAWGTEQGLRGEYFSSRRPGGKDRRFERVDAVVAFDFGTESPDPEKISEPREFSIRWEGTVLVSDSGDYEFIVRTDHATRLWVNNQKTPLIDAYVKSGADTEYRGSIRLLGGRAYPLKLEFSKANQGVNDSDKQKNKPPKPASITLLWKPPHRPDEVIPPHRLSPQRGPELFVVQTPFPPDDRSFGYERGSSVSKVWDQATTDGAIETASHVVARLQELSGASDSAPDRNQKLRDFCYRFVERAFRRPLTDEQKKLFVDLQFDEAKSPEIAVKRVVLLALKSPRFLFREAGGSAGDPYDVASRLSFGLWDSVPDAELLKAAAAGQLATREQVSAQARRMLPNLRTRGKLREFFVQWLKVDQFPDLMKDPEQFPDFDETAISDLRTSLELFVEETVFSEASDFRQLISAEHLPLNGRLARFYGANLPEQAPFQDVLLAGEPRAGLLTHPYLLASFAYTSTSSPIHRGVFISRSLLGRTLKPPPEAVTPLPLDDHAELTTRERILLQTKSESCSSCHRMINPLGFTLEQFDAVGRFRTEEKGKPIDASGAYLTQSGETKQFSGVRDLAAFLAESDETHAAFVKHLFQNLVKQPLLAYGPGTKAGLERSFRQHEFNIRSLAAEIVVSAALPTLPPKP